jgi:hypothetical protein
MPFFIASIHMHMQLAPTTWFPTSCMPDSLYLSLAVQGSHARHFLLFEPSLPSVLSILSARSEKLMIIDLTCSRRRRRQHHCGGNGSYRVLSSPVFQNVIPLSRFPTFSILTGYKGGRVLRRNDDRQASITY